MAINAKRNGTKVVTGEVRFSFPVLFEPRSINDEGAPKYSLMVLVPKSDTATCEALRAAEKEAAEKGKAKLGGKVPAKLKSIIHDADEDGTAEDYPEREGHLYMNVSAAENRRPQVVKGKSLTPVLDASEVYSGCYGHVSLNAFAYNFSGTKGVSFGLNHVLVTRDGERLDGGTTADQDFEDIADEMDDDQALI